ncbi:MAG: hypothetical protein CR974_00870 [Gammaproteobacteria bacterium]|nr:MAG: hypothetical protein CR974_00870 [Gammaproteobacteria bacterium]
MRGLLIASFLLAGLTPSWGASWPNKTPPLRPVAITRGATADNTCPSTRSIKEKIQAIRETYAHINQQQKSYQILKMPLKDAPAGGEATAYFDAERLVKLVKIYHTATGKRRIEYYIENGELRFVFDVIMDVDDAMTGRYLVKKNRYYLFCGQMIRWLNADKQAVPVDSELFLDMAELWEREARKILHFSTP